MLLVRVGSFLVHLFVCGHVVLVRALVGTAWGFETNTALHVAFLVTI